LRLGAGAALRSANLQARRHVHREARKAMIAHSKARTRGLFRCSVGTLRARVKALGTDPARGFIRAEGIGGVRIEHFLGRNIRRSADEAADFVDDVLGPISLKGPIPVRGSVEGLARSAIKDASFNTATRALFVDLRGLSASQHATVRALVESGTAGTRKPIFFLD
jgi:hypothetical protein